MIRAYNKAYKFQLVPTQEQEKYFAQTFGCVRFIWNQLLGYSIRFYAEHKKFGSITPAKFKKEFPWLKEVDSLALANVQLNLKKAFRAFFDKKADFTRFKSKKHLRKSYTTNNQEVSQAIRIEDTRIRLPKIGYVKFIQHRAIEKHERIKSCTITMMGSGKYYVSILVEGTVEIKQVKPMPLKVIGLDFSMTSLFVTNTGEKANYPRYFRENEAKLQILSRSVSRKKRGSKNHYKARVKLARWHEHIAHKRNDFLHKLSTAYAQNYDAIIVEGLNMQSMSQSLNFGKSVADNGWGMFCSFIQYKLLARGKQFVKIDTWFPSSKMCSSCGAIKQKLALAERLYHCDSCEYTQDRDINAAINIRTAGMAGIAW